MFGAIQFEEFEGLTKMPQDVATAWAGVEGWTGATFKPIKFLGRQVCKGINFWFLAELTTITDKTSTKKIVTLAINGFNGKYAIIPSSIEEISFSI